jgi:signal transduction histidine kinase
VQGLFRSVWFEPAPPDPPARVWRDWVLAAVFVPAAILEGVLKPDLDFRVMSVIVVVGLVPAVFWRRTHPLPMVAVAFLVLAAIPLFTGGRPIDMMALAFIVVLPYALFRWGSGRQMVLGSLIIIMNALGPADQPRQPLPDLAFTLVFLSAVVAVATAVRYRARARARELDKVKLLEREQLARDLHDTVAHHVSAIVIRAQAGLATAGTDPDATVNALNVIEAEAARTLSEMRSLVRTLRYSDHPAGGDLRQLAADTRQGLPVDIRFSGDLNSLPATVGTALYRLAQESITNARRHARHATRIEVRVDVDETDVRLQVSDDGDPVPAGQPVPPGYGLLGMRERARLLGGTCQAGPSLGRGWTVTAVLPKVRPAT